MKILILANNDVGLYKFRRALLLELLNKGNTVVLSLPYGECVDDLVSDGCEFIDTPIDRRGINLITDIKLLIQYKKIIKKVQPDFVITYTIKPNVYGGMICRWVKKPYAINITGLGTAFQKKGLLRKIVVSMYKIACKNAKVIFFENEENRQLFIKERISDDSQTYRLNGAGVDLKEYKVKEYPTGEKIKFLFIGRVMEEKGINELFDAMRRLIDDNKVCELDVVGGYEEDYREKIEQYQKEGWLHYYGYQKDVKPFIEKCHCFVLPSWHEGMANTNLECAATARPIITTNIPGCSEAVEDGVTGILVPCKNAESLYIAMKKFMNLSYEERKKMGEAGRKRMESIFDKKKVVSKTIQYLKKANV